MKLRTRMTAIGIAALFAVPALVGASAAEAAPVAPAAVVSVHMTKVYANCTALNAKYKHGVGKKGAKDKVSGSTKPVTTFAVNNALYAKNAKSDRDKDGIACEKK